MKLLIIKKYTAEKVEQLELKLRNLADVNTEIKRQFRLGLKKIIGIDRRYEIGNIEGKRNSCSIIGLIY